MRAERVRQLVVSRKQPSSSSFKGENPCSPADFSGFLVFSGSFKAMFSDTGAR